MPVAVTVTNVQPLVTAPESQEAAEGASQTFTLGSFSDPGTDGPWTATVTWGDGATSDPIIVGEPGNFSPLEHVYTDNRTAGPSTVTVEVAEASPGEEETESPVGKATFLVDVINANPQAELSNGGSLAEGNEVTIQFADPFDPSAADTEAGFHYAFACDGAFPGTTPYEDSGEAPSVICPFDDGPSTATVRARIIDRDDGFSEYTTKVEVTNVPPTASFGAPEAVGEGSTIDLTFAGAIDPSTGRRRCRLRLRVRLRGRLRRVAVGKTATVELSDR